MVDIFWRLLIVLPPVSRYVATTTARLHPRHSSAWGNFLMNKSRLPWYWPTMTPHSLAGNVRNLQTWISRFRCAYVLARNGIVKCSHRSIKIIAARKNCPALEVVYWYNVTPKDNLSSSTSLADVLHRYHIRVWDIDATPLLNHK